MREADRIPACFNVELGPFDVEDVEEFFGARREVMLEDPPKGKEVQPLVPVSKMPLTVQHRWLEYLRMKAEGETPMNGVKPSSGKIGGRFVNDPLP